MATPPENKESNTFFVFIHDLSSIQDEFLSPVSRINEYPWRLRVSAGPPGDLGGRTYSFFLICDKSSEAELWKCTAAIKVTWSSDGGVTFHEHTFIGWDEESHGMHLVTIFKGSLCKECKIRFEITTKENGNSWRSCPLVNFDMYDCIIVCGEKKEKIHVNKQSLASQSPFFDSLFFGDFKEKNMKEIPIGDVDGEEFLNIIKLLYRFDGAYLSDQNVERVLQIADRFELKIVEDRVVAYLLASSLSTMSLDEKILISCLYDLHFFIENLEPWISVNKLLEYEEFEQFSKSTLRVLIKKFCRGTRRGHFGSILLEENNREEHPEQNGSVTTISISNDPWEPNQTEQFSTVHRINGYPWRLRLDEYHGIGRWLSLICDKSSESELWKCLVNLQSSNIPLHFSNDKATYAFSSWNPFNCLPLARVGSPDGSDILIEIAVRGAGERWRLRPILNPLEPLDEILLIGDLKKTLRVNKKSLASQSPFFDKLFFGDFKGKNATEFPIENVEYEEFENMIELVYRYNGASLTDDNVERVLELATRFEIQIIIDRVTSYLLPSSPIEPIHKAIYISERYNLPFLKDTILNGYLGYEQMKKMTEAPEFEQFSIETLRILFKRICI